MNGLRIFVDMNVTIQKSCTIVRTHIRGFHCVANLMLTTIVPNMFSCFCKQTQLGAQIFLICLLLFSTCFRQLCAHRQEKIPYLLYIDDCLVCRAEFIPPCIPDSHLYRVTNTRCCIGTVYSPDDGHIVAQNMQRKTIKILRKFVDQVGSIYKRLYKDAQSTKHTKKVFIHSYVHSVFCLMTGSQPLPKLEIHFMASFVQTEYIYIVSAICVQIS